LLINTAAFKDFPHILNNIYTYFSMSTRVGLPTASACWKQAEGPNSKIKSRFLVVLSQGGEIYPLFDLVADCPVAAFTPLKHSREHRYL
jgi:hypothetical protein